MRPNRPPRETVRSLYVPAYLERELGYDGRGVFDDFQDPQWSAVQIGVPGAARPQEMTKPYQEQEWVYACIRQIAENLQSAPITVYAGPKSAPEPVESGPVFDLFNAPLGPSCPSGWFVESIVSWLMLHGEAFAIPVRNGQIMDTPGLPDRFEVPTPSALREHTDDKSETFRWEIPLVGGRKVLIPPEALIQPKLWNPSSERRGMSPITLASLVGDPLYQANLFNGAIIRNSGNPGGIIEVDGAMAEPERKRLKEAFDQGYVGPQKAGRPMVLTGKASFKFNPMNHRDMQFLELMGWGRTAIAAIFGVPESILTNESANYATMIASERAFWQRTLIPLGRRISGWFNAWLMASGSREWIRFDTTDVEALQQSRAERIDEGEGLARLGYTAQEINEKLGLGMPGADDAPWRNEAWTTAATIPFSSIIDDLDTDTDTPAPSPPGSDDAEAEEEAGGDGAEETTPGRGHLLSRMTRGDDARRELESFRGGFLAKAEGRVLRKTVKVLRSQARDALALLAEIAGNRAPMNDLEVDRFLGLQQRWDKAMASSLEGEFWGVAEGSVKQITRELGSPFDFDRADPRWGELVENRLSDLNGVNQTTLKRLRGSLLKGVRDGDSLAGLRKRIIESFSGSRARGLVVARTEVGVIASSSRFQAMEDAEVARHEWVTAADDRVRETHVEVDGQIVNVGETFTNGLRYPLDPSGDASEVINCRCDAVAVL